MTVALIGSGNVATILGRLITKCNHRIVHVVSRNGENAKTLAAEFNADHSDLTNTNKINADIYIVAVSDAALEHCTSHFKLHDKLVLHTAGSVSIEVLKNKTSNYGVLYPLQSLRKEMQLLPSIPFLIDGNNKEVLKYIEDFALTLSKSVQTANDEERLKLHTAAVIVNNFTNHLYALAEDFCKNENVNFDLLKPLIMETAYRTNDISPAAVQTGPALRKDIHTMDKHLKVLTNYPKLLSVYLKLTDSIITSYPS